MTIKNLIYTIPIPTALYDSCLDAFARETGWTEESEHTQLEHSRLKLNEYVNTCVASYNGRAAAEAAREAATAQTLGALDTITTTLVVE